MGPAELEFAARAGVGGVLLLAGLLKLRSGHVRTRALVQGFQLLGPKGSGIFATVLPWSESAFGLALILDLGAPATGLATTGLLLIFAIAVGIALLRGQGNECGCFGATATTVSWQVAGRALVLALMVLVASV